MGFVGQRMVAFLSQTPQAHEAINTKWFEAIGLYNLATNFKRLKFEETTVYVSTYGVVRGR